MLAKAHKLDLRAQVSFLKTADKIRTEHFTLFSKENNSKLLFQVIIGRGTVKNAVERNALRRAVYDICAEFVLHHFSTKLSIVVLVRNKNLPTWESVLRSSIEAILK